ncbi:MAG: ATP-dependent helicase, partial [Armatimonadota bacterium]
ASRNFEQALAARQVPYQIVGGLRYYERAEIKDVLAYLRSIFNPADNLALRRIINKPTRGIGDSTVEGITMVAERNDCSLMEACRYFAANEDETARARNAVGAFYDLMMLLRQRARTAKLPDLVRALLEMSGMIDKLKESGKAEDEMRVENLQEFVTVAASFQRRRPDAGLMEFLEHIALISDLDQADDLTGSVSLMTLHSAKGLEFPVVFMASMEEGIFPHQRSIGSGDDREIEEERRLAYVGMTRAEKLLYLSYAFHRTIYGETRRQRPSRFLKDLPEELLDRQERYCDSRQPRMLDQGEDVLEEPKGGRSIDVASVLQNAKQRRDSGKPPKSRAKKKRKPSTQPPGDGWKSGQKVRHSTFGQGMVVSAEPLEEDWKVTVAFKNGGGVRKLLAGVAGLEKL